MGGNQKTDEKNPRSGDRGPVKTLLPPGRRWSAVGNLAETEEDADENGSDAGDEGCAQSQTGSGAIAAGVLRNRLLGGAVEQSKKPADDGEGFASVVPQDLEPGFLDVILKRRDFAGISLGKGRIVGSTLGPLEGGDGIL